MSFLVLLLACTNPEPAKQWCAFQGTALGTTWTVKWSTDAEVCDEKRVDLAVSDVLAEVDAQMSTWRKDSELSKVRAGPGAVAVSEDTAGVVRDALALAAATDGAFDPTVQPLMEVWGFHGKDRTIARPTDDALAAARAQVGWQKVSLAYVGGAPHIDAGGTALDLSAIAKGHAVDRVSAVLSQLGHADSMAEVGGEVRVTGSGPHGPWVLGVDAPVEGSAPGAELIARIALVDRALASSGNYRNLVEVDGRKVAHTMDPRTGEPATTDVLSASVVARDCRTADALATAVMVLGSEAGLALLEARSDVEGLVVTGGPDGFALHETSGMGLWKVP
ncbi:MAG: FAD:protein FMN transferase [Alphaproteobacteria bacterium]|nr:FAD:protein FMN transferase [Alphaproteobacteria bacterium]